MPVVHEGAGASADIQADLLADYAASTQAQITSLVAALRELRRREGSFRVGADGERRLAERVQTVLVDLGSVDWHLLVDRAWPGTRRANIDLLLVGPAGVLVLDVKTWRRPRIEDGTLWRDTERADDDLEHVRAQAAAVADVLADVGAAPAAVLGWVVLAGQRLSGVDLDGVRVVGELSLQRELTRLGPRLSTDQVGAIVSELDRACPPATQVRPQRRVPASRSIASQPVPAQRATPVAAQLPLNVDDVWEGVLEAALAEPIESWMVWLHPLQAQLVSRTFKGPARVRGAAGTGKTVVALHRARHLAAHPDARVLVTSFVRTLPAVHRNLFQRLAPEAAERVQFQHLHSWAARLLLERGQHFSIDAQGTAFARAWAEAGQPLAALGLDRAYWRDEISAVIKGRALTRVEEYLDLVRVGRRTPLRAEQRRLVWTLYEAYEAELRRLGGCDWDDLLIRALDVVRADPTACTYTAVIVDEVQDLTCVGLRLLHALVGDSSDGLFLVGDGQQSVYPGGFTLTEVGISVQGRASVLTRNYRNAAEIVRRARDVVATDEFNDLEDGPESGLRAVDIDREGGQVAQVDAADTGSQEAALVHALRWTVNDGVRSGDMAVLVPTRREARRWRDRLTLADVPVIDLADYDGMPVEAVKVGTYQRAKGLEFACVFLPDHDRAVSPRSAQETYEAYRERAELQRRQLFVAMTRARDRLWLGRVQPA